MSQNELLEQKLAGILSSLDNAPTSELHHSVSVQFAENYNRARNGVLAQNPELKDLSPPTLDINPDIRGGTSYLDIKTYVSELHTFVHNKIIAERAAFKRANPPRVIRDDYRH
jgi:hypothetical protein